MTILATHHTATGAKVTVTEILAPTARWVVRCGSCNLHNEPSQYFAHEDAEDAAEHHAKECTGQPPTVEANTCPGADQLRALINQARPGITPEQARFNGQRFRSELAIAQGVTGEVWHDWLERIVGNVLIVHLDPDGKPLRPKTVALWSTPDEAERVIATNPNAVVIADWSTPATPATPDEDQPQAARGHVHDDSQAASR